MFLGTKHENDRTSGQKKACKNMAHQFRGSSSIPKPDWDPAADWDFSLKTQKKKKKREIEKISFLENK